MGQSVWRCLVWPQPSTTDDSTQCIDTQAGPLGPGPSLLPHQGEAIEKAPWGGGGCFSGPENSLKEAPSQMHLGKGNSSYPFPCSLPEQPNYGNKTFSSTRQPGSSDGRAEAAVTLGES